MHSSIPTTPAGTTPAAAPVAICSDADVVLMGVTEVVVDPSAKPALDSAKRPAAGDAEILQLALAATDDMLSESPAYAACIMAGDPICHSNYSHAVSHLLVCRFQ